MRFRLRGGKEVYRSIPEASTLKQAKLAEQAAKNAIFEQKYGIFVDETTFAEFVDDVYFQYIETHNVNVYSKKLFTKTLLRFFGDMRLRDITPQDCRNFIKARKRHITIHGRKLSNASINKELSTLSKIFNIAIEERKLESNPMRPVKILKEAKPRERILTPKEKERFDAVISEDELLHPLSLIAMHTGLRKGQILAIRAEDVDFEMRTVCAIASKGREARRVPLNQTMVRVFEKLLADYPSGELFPVKDFRARWNRAMKRAKIDDFHFHDLKHAFGTELIRRGSSPDLVQMLFAHSDRKISEIYMNQKLELMAREVERLDDVQELGEI